jgi:hypothetical protein
VSYGVDCVHGLLYILIRLLFETHMLFLSYKIVF